MGRSVHLAVQGSVFAHRSLTRLPAIDCRPPLAGSDLDHVPLTRNDGNGLRRRIGSGEKPRLRHLSHHSGATKSKKLGTSINATRASDTDARVAA